MGDGIVILSSIIFGILSGIGLVLAFFFIKTFLENRKVKKLNPNIVEEIELNKRISKKIQNDRNKKIKEIRERNRESNGFSERERIDGELEDIGEPEQPDEQPDEQHSDEDSITEQSRVSVSETGFNLRD